MYLSSSVIRQKGESQNGCFKKTKHAKFSEKVRFSQNLACFVFLKHPFWDSPFSLITNEFNETVLVYLLRILFKIKILILFHWTELQFISDYYGTDLPFLHNLIRVFVIVQITVFTIHCAQFCLVLYNLIKKAILGTCLYFRLVLFESHF